MFRSRLGDDTLTTINEMPKDTTTNTTIPDGREAWARLSAWYEGSTAKSARRRYARQRIKSLTLGGTTTAGTYLANMTKMFTLLEYQGETMNDNPKINALLGGITDKRYQNMEEIITDDETITYKQVLERIRSRELKLQMSTDNSRKANTGRRSGGRGGGRGGQGGG